MGKFDDGSGEADTLQQQLMKLKSEISTASTTIKTAEMKMKHDSQELKKAEAELKKYENSTDNLNFKQAKEILMKCLRLSNMGDNTYKFHISVINKNGTKVIGPLDIDSKWEVAKMIFHSK